MEDIHIQGYKGAYIIPTVDFYANDGVCELSGESFLEETAKFYSPLLDWIKEFIYEVKKPITFNFKLTYFNTSTSKWILNILNVLKRYEENGGNVFVNWYYHEDDIDMQDDIEDYIIDTGLQINLHVFED
jgi:hypothetical protein